MKKGIQKFLVVTVALLTFGIISPNHAIWDNILDEQSSSKATISSANPTRETVVSTYTDVEPATKDYILNAAKEQSYLKFGSKIGPKIENEFDDIIFPKMEEVITMTVGRLDNQYASLAVSEKPAGNYSEKIFHIYDTMSGEDVIRFHVRTEKRPFDGYYYNFHYHTSEDQFNSHYTLGEIFWSKNTPPKWLS